jgi:hypothetical protein
VTDPPTAVSVTATGPAAWAGVRSVTLVGLVIRTVVAGDPPKSTATAPRRLVPVIVTGVPPVTLPAGGVTDEMVGLVTKRNGTLEVAVPPIVVTETVTPPGPWDLVVAVTLDPVVTRKPSAVVVPKVTELAPVR